LVQDSITYRLSFTKLLYIFWTMKVILIALFTVGAVGTADPLGKVYELMDSLAAKITAEGEAESKAYKEYVDWCGDAGGNLRFEIKSGNEKKEELEATISKCKADIEACSVKIEDLSGAISADGKELEQATAMRKKDNEVFVASEKELMDAVDTLERAVGLLEKEMQKAPAALMQVDRTNLDSVLKGLDAVINAASFSSADHQALTALIQSSQAAEADNEDDELGAPSVSAYKTHSSSIYDVLEDLKEKAETKLGDLRKAEANSKHNYDMLKQSLEDQMEADTKDMEEEKSLKASTEETKATADGDLAECVKGLAEDQAALKTASTTCMTVAADHEASLASRKEELKAIATAEKILRESTGGAQKQSYSLLQMRMASKMSSRADLKNAEVVSKIKQLAKKHHSAALAQLASQVGAAIRYGDDDVFGKVKGLISEMISKLEKQAEAEASEKQYCDEELAKTEDKKSELDATLKKLASKIDLAAATSAERKAEVKDLQAELAVLAKEQAEMDAIRAEEKALYDTAKAELEAGIAGVQKALGVLRDYYEGTAFVQTNDNFDAFMQQPAPPKKHSASGGAGGSIIDILEVCVSDFTKNLADEETQEADALSVYEKETQENKLTTTTKTQDVKYKTKEFKTLDKQITDLSSERDNTKTELSAVIEYYGKIKERCIAKPETYEERKGRREAEITGLKEALSILESETAFMQKGRKGHRRHHFMN